MNGATRERAKTVWQIVVFIILLDVDVVLLFKFVAQPSIQVSLLGAIVVVSALLALSPRLYEFNRLRAGSTGVEVEFAERLDRLDTEVAQINKRIERLFLTTMSGAMWLNLKKLYTGHFGEYEMNGGLNRELHYLRDIGYIEILNKDNSIGSIPPKQSDLSQYVRITKPGREFVDLRLAMRIDDEPSV